MSKKIVIVPETIQHSHSHNIQSVSQVNSNPYSQINLYGMGTGTGPVYVAPPPGMQHPGPNVFHTMTMDHSGFCHDPLTAYLKYYGLEANDAFHTHHDDFREKWWDGWLEARLDIESWIDEHCKHEVLIQPNIRGYDYYFADGVKCRTDFQTWYKNKHREHKVIFDTAPKTVLSELHTLRDNIETWLAERHVEYHNFDTKYIYGDNGTRLSTRIQIRDETEAVAFKLKFEHA